MAKKILSKFDKEKELLKEIVTFNSLVAEQRKVLDYRTLQIEQGIKVNDDETDKKFNAKFSELTQLIQVAKSNIELKYNVKINNESMYYGILPELLLSFELNYFLDETKKAKFSKVTEICIQEKIEM